MKSEFLLKTVLILGGFFFTGCREKNDLSELFHFRQLKGVLVYSDEAGKITVSDQDLAETEFSPASTFKVINTLIALETKVADKRTVFRWDKVEREFPDWNRDQTLKSAFEVSCVWCYQELARKIGPERYADILGRIRYGNIEDVSGKLAAKSDSFWLDGTLKISPKEQVELLRRLFLQLLPFQSENFKTLFYIMRDYSVPDMELYGKTGWARDINPPIGWYIGMAKYRGKTWYFSLAAEIADKAQLVYRKEIVIEAIRKISLP